MKTINFKFNESPIYSIIKWRKSIESDINYGRTNVALLWNYDNNELSIICKIEDAEEIKCELINLYNAKQL